jgi:alcohol dehydrogenase (cytochrome c)
MTFIERYSSQRCLTAAALLGLGAVALALQLSGPLNAQSNNNATYTAAQAEAGRNAYSQTCASCHGPNTDDGEFAPPLKGTSFMQKYAGKPVNELVNYMTSRMPPGNPGSLGAPVYGQIAAFVFQQNGAAPDNAELPTDARQLATLVFPGAGAPGGRGSRGPGPGPGGGLTPGVRLPPPPAKTNPLDKITPVSDAMLQNPPPGDWLTWRRGFEPPQADHKDECQPPARGLDVDVAARRK